jgi:hypothetical protein
VTPWLYNGKQDMYALRSKVKWEKVKRSFSKDNGCFEET